SDPAYWANPNRTFDAAGNFMISYPREGFFHIRQGAASAVEAGDVEESSIPLANKMLNSFRSNSHVLLFTNRLRGNRQQDYAVAPVPAGSPLLGSGTNYYNQDPEQQYQPAGSNSVNSQWIIVGYYLVLKGTTIDQNNPT